MRDILICLLLIISSWFSTANAQEPGVSRQLAQERARRVSDVGYKLHFSIPTLLQEKVRGRAEIRFKLTDAADDMWLDFCGDVVDKTMTINGKHVDTHWANQHILLSRYSLSKGENRVEISFTSADKSLNRHADFLYTLFVPANARSVFPCFDQPDLKALFAVDLDMPQGWTSLTSDSTHLLPTYLFSFVAGKFQRQTVVRDGRELTALYRETDPKKVAQLDKCFDEAALSLRWLETYTGIPYPFSRDGFVVLPGYQFGGMEHPGAIQFTDREIFLGEKPTPDEELTRLELIAHETSHMWFGDLVTMRWFNDVWTKEVFANFLASKISREQFPDINHDLNFLKAYQMRALSTDRTPGTHPIQQPLDNLRDAGLLYGNIIYDKAPVMMRKLEQLMGAEAFRRGLQAYLRCFAYSNATWDDLIALLDGVAPQADLNAFSEVWVKQKGLPDITCRSVAEGVEVKQRDRYGRGLVWPQQFGVAVAVRDSLVNVVDTLTDTLSVVKVPSRSDITIPNYDGSGYGRFLYSQEQIRYLMERFDKLPDLNRMAALMNLYENFLDHRISPEEYFEFIRRELTGERNALVASTMARQLAAVKWYSKGDGRHAIDRFQWSLCQHHPLTSLRLQVLRSLGTTVTDSLTMRQVRDLWSAHSDSLLTEHDYTQMAYHLALLSPSESSVILTRQRERLHTADERNEFDYVSRGCTPDTVEQRRLFYSLVPSEGRRVEPWARQLLALLCDESRETQANTYLRPGLDALLSIQQSSDIFFPGYWLGSLLGDHHSVEAQSIVREWIDSHVDYPATLLNKVKEQAYPLLNQ